MLHTFKYLLIATLILSNYSHAKEATVPNESEYVMTMTDIKGKSYKVTPTENGLNIAGLEGKIIFLEFFGHKCPPCLASIPHLIRLQDKHKDKLAIISIEVQGYNQEQTAAFAKRKGLNTIVVSSENASELISYIELRAQWTGAIPYLVALDPTGNVRIIQAGMLPEAALEEIIEELSKKPEPMTEKNATSAKNNKAK